MRTWADEVEDQRRERDREQRRLIECQHGALRRQCEICERDMRIAELEAALRNMLDIVEALEPNAITFTEKDEANAARAVLGS